MPGVSSPDPGCSPPQGGEKHYIWSQQRTCRAPAHGFRQLDERAAHGRGAPCPATGQPVTAARGDACRAVCYTDERMPNPEPLTLVAGESITVDGSGKASVSGVYDTVTADAFPSTSRPFSILCRCRFAAAGKAQVVIERPDGGTLLALEPIRITGPGDAQQVHTVTGLVFPAAGDSRIALVGPDGPVATTPIAVRLRS